ncbi:hypothetical protein PM10SUCC1_28230 [Propionigenium maris DSM 9537]|uniref:Uncharacterized protein n=1 Tax=Propionigenium maris DSM 9537 TaxID=1123000 RepID=A0A9W6GLI5_9FUSO|nr:hypothetical protein PM10SUCC1_28230 [Propionigenium maris DSM 9537]
MLDPSHNFKNSDIYKSNCPFKTLIYIVLVAIKNLPDNLFKITGFSKLKTILPLGMYMSPDLIHHRILFP